MHDGRFTCLPAASCRISTTSWDTTQGDLLSRRL